MTTSKRTTRPRRIAIVTGTRAEYGLLRSTMEAIARRKNLQLQLVVTGMHLLKQFGQTYKEIVKDGWLIDVKVPMQRGDDSPGDQAMGLSRGIAGISKFFIASKTDIVVVLGDRIEAMAGAIAAVTTGRKLAHIHGGDVAPGDFDDAIRHAITKLAHIHFPATQSSAKRIISMGEDASQVHCVGAPGLDDLRLLKKSLRKMKDKSNRALIVQHPTGRSADTEFRVMHMILGAVSQAGLDRTIILPNTDRGHSGIQRAIDRHVKSSRKGEALVYASLPRNDFLKALIQADILVGNSSCGIIEAPFACTPSVNVGSRQQGRDRAGNRVLDCRESKSDVSASIKRAITMRQINKENALYGSKAVGPKIAAILSRIPLSS